MNYLEHTNAITHLIAQLTATLNTPDQRDGLTGADRMKNGYNGWPSGASLDTGSRGSVLDDQGVPMPNISDPTGEAALRADRARDDEHEILRQLRNARRALDRAVTIANRYQLRDPSEWDLAEAAEGEPGCVSCARIKGPRTTRWWNPIARHTTLANGVRVGLCWYCYHAAGIGARHTGELPPKEAVEAQRDGRRYKRTG